MYQLEKRQPFEFVDDDVLVFAAFALVHAACGDGVLDLRVGENCILQWCPYCAEMEMFLSTVEGPGAMGP